MCSLVTLILGSVEGTRPSRVRYRSTSGLRTTKNMRKNALVREREGNDGKLLLVGGRRGCRVHRSLPTFVDAAERVAEREDEAGLAVDVAGRGVARGVAVGRRVS